MLQIRALRAGYGDRLVLHGVDLDVPAGQLTALLGPNGAGKSTLLRAVSGVIAPRRGQVIWAGQDVAALSTRARARLLAVVPQRLTLPGGFTVWQAVMMGRTPYLNFLGQPGPHDRQAVQSALEQVGAADLADRPVEALSGGEQQRVLLARALAQETPLLLLDEPTTHLDLYHQMHLLTLLQGIRAERGLTVLLVLHDLNLAARFADRIALLQHGRVLAAGEPTAVLTAERLSALYGWPLEVRLVDETQLILPASPSEHLQP